MAAKTRDELFDAVTEAVDSLTRPMQLTRTVAGVTEPFVLPSLLAQLRATLCGSSQATEDGSASIFQAKAPIQGDVLDGLLEIERTVDHWQNLLRVSHRTTTESRLRGILGAASTLTDLALLKGLGYDLGRLATIAAVLTEWESVPFKPQGTCPRCEARGTLRIREASKTGLCVSCRAHWTPDTIGILAEYVREDNARRAALKAATLEVAG